jgi:hypothetical protein
MGQKNVAAYRLGINHPTQVPPIVLAFNRRTIVPNRSGCLAVNRRTIVPIVLAVWLLTVGRLSQIVLAVWLLTVGRLSQSFWLFGC